MLQSPFAFLHLFLFALLFFILLLLNLQCKYSWFFCTTHRQPFDGNLKGKKSGAIQWKILIICLQIYTHFRRGMCVCVRLHFIPMLLLVGYAVEAYWNWSESGIPRMIVHKKRHKTIPYRLHLHMGWMHWSSLLEYCSTVYPLSELNAIFLNLTS